MSDNKKITEGMSEEQLKAFQKITADEKNQTDKDDPANEEFDIAYFIVKHSTNYSVKKSKAPRIIAIIVVAFIIIGLCVIIAISSANGNKNPIFGKWVSSEGVEMEIIEDYITIDGSSRKYVFPKGEDNVIAISINEEYFKILYKLENGKLYIIIPSADGESETIEYVRKRE